MALTNPIAFRELNEANAKTTKTVTAGGATAKVMGIVVSPDTSKTGIAAGGNGAIYYNGEKLVQGVSADEKKYLYDQLSSTYNNKYAVSVQSYSPTSGQYSTSLTAQTVTFTVKTTHGGTNINKTSSGAKVVSVKIGSTELTETSTAGVWTGTMSASASTNGSQSTSVTVTVNFTGDYGDITRTVNASWSKYAPFYFVSSTKANLATAIGSATANNKTSYAGTYSFKTTAGTDMWICFPSKWGKPTVKSGGFDVPFDAAVQVTVGNTVYNCFRKSTTPTAATGTMSIVLS